MNLTRINTFLILAETLSFSETAKQSNCTQPAISQQIKLLEQELGGELFTRKGKTIELNQNGLIFKEFAQKILNTWNQAKDQISVINKDESGEFHFGASNFVGIYLLPLLLNKFQHAYPNIDLNIEVRSPTFLLPKLNSGELEFLITSDRSKFDPTFYESTLFYLDDIIIVAHKDHPLVQEKNPTFNSLTSHTMLWQPKNSLTRPFLDEQVAKHKLHIKKTIEISSLEALKQSVLHNLGITFMSRCAVQHELNDKQLVEIKIPELNMHHGVQYVTHKEHVLSPSAQRFISMLSKDVFTI